MPLPKKTPKELLTPELEKIFFKAIAEDIEKAMWFGTRAPSPTERQLTLSRLTGRPPEDFIL